MNSNIYKIVLVGDSGVGKSNIIKKYVNNTDSLNPTIGIEFYTKSINNNDKIIKYQIWDSSGQERYRAITKAYYYSARVIILVYDITNINSFNNIEKWLNMISVLSSSSIKILVGNKIDLEHIRMVQKLDGEKLAKKYNFSFFMEISSNNLLDVNNLFSKIDINDIVENNTNEFIKILNYKKKNRC